MRTISKSFRGLFAILLLLGSAGCERNKEPAEIDIKEFLEMAPEERLASEERVGEYWIRPPTTLTKIDLPLGKNAPPGARGVVWGGKSDLAAETGIVVVVIPLPSDSIGRIDDDKALRAGAERQSNTWKHKALAFSVSPFKTLSFKGSPALRSEAVWVTKERQNAHIASYILRDGTNVVSIGAIGVGDRYRESCAAMLESIMTLRGGGLSDEASERISADGLWRPDSDSRLAKLQELILKHGRERVFLLEVNPSGIFDEPEKKQLVEAIEKRISERAGGLETMLVDTEPFGIKIAAAPVNDYQAFVEKLDLGSSRFGATQLSHKTGSLSVHLDGDFIRDEFGILDHFEKTKQAMEQSKDKIDKQRPFKDKSEFEQFKQYAAKRHAELTAEAAASGGDASFPKPGDSDYFERLIEVSQQGHFKDKDRAIDALISANPDDATMEIRKQVAQMFKKMAFDGHLDEQKKGVRGMVAWGGKYSVPLLLELLDSDSSRFSREEVYLALGRLQDERAARPVAAKLEDFFDRKEAYACLQKMGQVAEDALIEIAPSNDADVCLAAVKLLGEIGTEKSYPILRKALKSNNNQVSQAARLSIHRIKQRETSQ